MRPTVDLCIVGAGAAGLAAAIFAAEEQSGLAVHVLDGAKSIGAKILISGGGRCNVTHEVVTPTDFHGNVHIIRNVLAAFDAESTRRWFLSLGVELKCEETGKLFPVTDKARTVLEALIGRCRDAGVVLCPDHRVQLVMKDERCNGPTDGGPLFRIHHAHGALLAKRVILATGGRSLPRTGSDGLGYDLASRLGHKITPTAPALVPLVLNRPMFHEQLAGLSVETELTTTVERRVMDRRTGGLLWTHFGVSGPVVMDASRFWTLAQLQKEQVALYANFLPGRTEEDVRAWLLREAGQRPRRSLAKTVAQLLPERLVTALCVHAGCAPEKAVALLPRKDRERFIDAVIRFRFHVARDRGWNHAEVTAGGVPLEEINFRTMESKLVPGLYLAGEILDCDGRIGGFNFQWAWATGYLAGRAAAAEIARSFSS
jgi:predicted Rossmann fold flavoprotein